VWQKYSYERGEEMRLSEAIRLGAMVSEPSPREFKSYTGGTCAIGSGLLAIGALDGIIERHCDDAGEIFKEAVIHFPIIGVDVECPACGVKHGSDGMLYDSVMQLFDYHKWTREQIADWVESVERQREAPLSLDADLELSSCVYAGS
jgi:hypothetical protein